MSFSQVVLEGETWHMFAASEDLRYSRTITTVHAVSTDRGLHWHAVNCSVMPGQDACVFPLGGNNDSGSNDSRSSSHQQQSNPHHPVRYGMLYERPGMSDQRGCQPFLALLNGSLASTIPTLTTARASNGVG